MNKLYTSVIVLFTSLMTYSQAPVGQWESHIPNSKALSLCEVGDKIYCATETGIFYYNTSDNSIQKISKVDGLSGVNSRCISYHQPTNTIYIGYKDGTIDLIKNTNQIITLTDINRKSYTSKVINKIKIIDDLIYFCTDFGIVVYDPYKLEFKDTYIIGDSGYEIRVNNITASDRYLYAATLYGVKKADKNSNQLANYETWERIDYIPYSNRDFRAVTWFNNKLIAGFKNDRYASSETYIIDEINQTYDILDTTVDTYTEELKVINDKLFLIQNKKINIYSDFQLLLESFTKTSMLWGNIALNSCDAIIDKNNNMWYADKDWGLVKSNYNKQMGEHKIPNAPESNTSYYIYTHDATTWLAHGAVEVTGANTNTPASISKLINNNWITYSQKNISELQQAVDIISVEEVPNNPNKVYCASGANGILEFNFSNSGQAKVTYHNDTTGSTLLPQYKHRVQVADLHFDENLNLWSINPYTNTPINVKTATGEWKAFPYGNSSYNYGQFMIAEDGAKWIIINMGKGLYVFNDFGTIDNLDDDFAKQIDVKDEYGTIISNDIYAIDQDKNEQIWLGTDNGIVVYYSPNNIYEQNNFYASKIIIEINGKAEYLMEGKRVTALAVDGANRKWIGTDQSGVFLMSEDGTEQLLTFNTENSPLPSDKIKSISIDNKTGVVFIATGSGLMSYRGEATEGTAFFENVYAFPNPVKPDYTGPITITGLMENTIVKITDISGNLVTEMNSLGGQAIWDGRNLNGNKVKTGIYLVFLSNTSGEETAVTKILFIN